MRSLRSVVNRQHQQLEFSASLSVLPPSQTSGGVPPTVQLRWQDDVVLGHDLGELDRSRKDSGVHRTSEITEVVLPPTPRHMIMALPSFW